MDIVCYDDLVKKNDEDLLKLIATEGGAVAGSPAGSEQVKRRDAAKAILDYRLREKIEILNISINKLNNSTTTLSCVLIFLTIILVFVGILTLRKM